jgi:hypothetical protein
VLLAVSCFSSTYAQEENLVTGKTYGMYFLTAINNDIDNNSLSHMHVTFKEGGCVAVDMIDGHGIYFAVPGFFAATYYAVGVRMGFESMDVFTAMTGISIDPLIAGVGYFLIDYTQIDPYVCTGFVLAEEEMEE